MPKGFRTIRILNQHLFAMKKTPPNTKEGYQYLNFTLLTSMIAGAMQREKGSADIDFDLAADIAWDVSQQISGEQLIERKRTMTVEEILESRPVRESETTRLYDPEVHNRQEGVHPFYAIICFIALIVALVAIILS